MAHWYYANGGTQNGPVDEADLGRAIGRGEILPDSLVWTEGMDNWSAARSSLPGHLIPQSWVDGLSAPVPPPQPAYQSQPYQSSSAPAANPSYVPGSYHHPISFGDAVKTVFSRYATFRGRARRREYWYWILFTIVVTYGSLALALLTGAGDNDPGIVAIVFACVFVFFPWTTLLPTLGVTARRLHDIGRSGWWQLLPLIPLIGLIVLLVFLVRESDPNDNEFGPA